MGDEWERPYFSRCFSSGSMLPMQTNSRRISDCSYSDLCPKSLSYYIAKMARYVPIGSITSTLYMGERKWKLSLGDRA